MLERLRRLGFLVLVRFLFLVFRFLSFFMLFFLLLLLSILFVVFFSEGVLVKKSRWIEWIRWRMRLGFSSRVLVLSRGNWSVLKLSRWMGSCFLNWFKRLVGSRLILVVWVWLGKGFFFGISKWEL